MKLLTSALIALAVAAPGAAMAAPIANGQGWTGFYAGGHVGGLRPDFEGLFDQNDPPANFNDLNDWFLGAGGQIGYDWQAPGMGGIVLGVVIDATYVHGEADVTEPDISFPDTDISGEINWIGSARVRAGLPVADFMPYVTAGASLIDFTIEHTRENFDPGLPLPWEIDEQEWGYVLGVGMDWAVASNVTVGAEALFHRFDYEQDLSDFPDGDDGDYIKLDSLMSYRLTVNYRF